VSLLIIIASLCFLMFIAYRGYSVILFAPIAAMGAVFFTDPSMVPAVFTGLFMEKMVVFVKLYFPVFLLGAIFGKVIELSGFAKSIVNFAIHAIGEQRAMLSIVLVCGLLTYGGVSVFVVVFAVYPFAAELFKASSIPKRLIPGTLALGSFTFSMDALPGSPQIQNVIPTTFFKTDIYAGPWLGVIGGVFVLMAGLAYLEWMRRRAHAAGEGYGEGHINEPAPIDLDHTKLPSPLLAVLPLALVAGANKLFTELIPQIFGETQSFIPAVIGKATPVVQKVGAMKALWAVEGALLVGIACVFLLAFKPVVARFAEGSKAAVNGAILAALNTASEYGYGSVIASLSGFLMVSEMLKLIPNPLLNEALSVTTLSAIVGSSSGGLSIALAAMSDLFIANATAAGIPLEVMHRIASMASGGMDTLPHNGAVITLLMVTGLSHRQSYKDIFAITVIKSIAVFVVIAAFYLTGLV